MKPSPELTRIIQAFNVLPQEPEEVLVQRQLKRWLEPGWCRYAPAGSEPNIYQKRRLTFRRIAVILMLLWLLGLATSYLIGGFQGEGGTQAPEPVSSFHVETSQFVNSHEQPGRHEQSVSA
jgi:hypothetical protein